jgi:hypothetical protein
MQDVVHEYVALWTEIVGAVRASVPAEWANPIRSGIRRPASSSVGRVWV